MLDPKVQKWLATWEAGTSPAERVVSLPAPLAARLLAFVQGWLQAHSDADQRGLPGQTSLDDARGLEAELRAVVEGVT